MSLDHLERLLRKAGVVRTLSTLHANQEHRLIITRLIDKTGLGAQTLYRVKRVLLEEGLIEEVKETYPRHYTWIKLAEKGVEFVRLLESAAEMLAHEDAPEASRD